MRPKNRIKPFLEKIEELWSSCDYLTDWRFGQLMSNFQKQYGDPFYWEEKDFIKKFEEFLQPYIDMNKKL